MKKLSIIIPAYNEKRYISIIISNLKKLRLKDIKKEIIIVDDASTDGTKNILKRYINDPQVKLHFSRINRGKGSSIRAGLKYATGDIIIFQDADLECDVNDYPSLIRPILDNKADVVFGSRFSKKNEHVTFLGFLGNYLISLFASLLFLRRVTDEATVYKVFKSGIIKDLNLKARRFEICPEITAKILKNRKIRYAEVPIKYKPRSKAEGKKLRLIKDGIEAAWTLLKYRIID